MRKVIRTSKSYLIEGKLVKRGTRIILEDCEDLGSAPMVKPEMEDVYAMRRKKRLGRFSRMDIPAEDMEDVGGEAMETDSPVDMEALRRAKRMHLRRACKRAEDTSDDGKEDMGGNAENSEENEVKTMRRARIARMRRLRRMSRR